MSRSRPRKPPGITRPSRRNRRILRTLSAARSTSSKDLGRIPSVQSETAAAFSLLSAQAVRERAHRMLALGLDDKLPHFRVDLARLDTAVDLVLRTTRQNYPTLDVPFHSRWRHFVCNGEDRWAALAEAAKWSDGAAKARAAFDLAIVSVLLDAGAGSQWHYRDAATRQSIGRSEG